MASDIKLDGNAVLVEGTGLIFDRGQEKSSVALNLKNPNGFWHISGPRSYEPNNPLSIFWHNNSQYIGPFLSVTTNGRVGIGTNNPVRSLHVEGNEIHSGGSGGGFSFSDRSKPGLVDNPANGERWVWYANDEAARLWSGEDVMTVKRNAKSWRTELQGRLFVENDIETSGDIRGKFNGQVLGFTGREIGPSSPRIEGLRITAIPFSDPIHLHTNGNQADPKIALFHDFERTKMDALVINYQGTYKNGVRIEGNVQVTGALTQASSIALKENVAELSGQEAMAALQGLNAVKFNYKADGQKEQRIGFIAEEVPDLVASAERDHLSPMDIVAVLTKAMQEQQKMLAELAAEVNDLRGQGS